MTDSFPKYNGAAVDMRFNILDKSIRANSNIPQFIELISMVTQIYLYIFDEAELYIFHICLFLCYYIRFHTWNDFGFI